MKYIYTHTKNLEFFKFRRIVANVMKVHVD
jgi:hypothetical protein